MLKQLFFSINKEAKVFVLTMLVATLFFDVKAFAQDEKEFTKSRVIIYQLLPRLFGNKNSNNIPFGTLEENGSGKFNDITDKALDGLKELHVNYVWYTGVLAHASLTDYSKFGIKSGDADVIKGRAGSPYAITDYYDVDPDLAVNVKNRMLEFENLIKRTHQKKIKVIIDFIPNHVARSYQSIVKPKGVVDFGANDDNSLAFSPNNDFYYLPNQSLKLSLPNKDKNNRLSNLMDGVFSENPAKVTGNNVFLSTPAPTDWYETVKLNYGVDYQNNTEKKYFSPIPPVWIKMRDILIFWTNKGVDGFRCDVAEMVPVEFWEWVIPQVKIHNTNLIFIAEAYNSKVYQKYLNQGKFDYLYDKVGLYDGLKKLIKNESNANVNDISTVWQFESANFGNQMLRFLENHDEERLASTAFAGDAKLGIPAMVVCATLSGGPVMIYSGQEVGEPAGISEGYIGDDTQNARTTIFEYWGLPNHQKWMNNGKFDGALLSPQEKQLRSDYQNILKVASTNDALLNGDIAAVTPTETMNNKMYGFFRFSAKQRILVIVNFDRKQELKAEIEIPKLILGEQKPNPKDLLNNKIIKSINNTTLSVQLHPGSAQIIEF
jgi:glycosidase